MVLPSIDEGLALVMGEALACGCPVIASSNTGALDLFSDGKEGYIIPIRSSEIIYDKLQTLADNPEIQNKMSIAAIKKARLIQGWGNYQNKWKEKLKSIKR